MFACILLALVAISSAKSVLELDPLSLEAIDRLNGQPMTWKAGMNFGEGWTIEDIKAMCGVLHDWKDHRSLPGIQKVFF